MHIQLDIPHSSPTYSFLWWGHRQFSWIGCTSTDSTSLNSNTRCSSLVHILFFFPTNLHFDISILVLLALTKLYVIPETVHFLWTLLKLCWLRDEVQVLIAWMSTACTQKLVVLHAFLMWLPFPLHPDAPAVDTISCMITSFKLWEQNWFTVM